MRGKFRLARREMTRRSRHARCRLGHDDLLDHQIADQRQADLAAAHQLHIYLRQQLRVEQRAVQHAVRAIDAVARAERVQRQLGAGVTLLGDRQRIHHPRHADHVAPAAAELAVEEAEVERGIVRD